MEEYGYQADRGRTMIGQTPQCEYCNHYHDIYATCPINRRDSLHRNAQLEPTIGYPEALYGERLEFGFTLLYKDDEIIRNSGVKY